MAYWEYDVNYKMVCEPGSDGKAHNCNMNCIYNWTTSNRTYNPSGMKVKERYNTITRNIFCLPPTWCSHAMIRSSNYPSGVKEMVSTLMQGSGRTHGWMAYLHMYCHDSPMWKKEGGRFPSVTNTQPMAFWGHKGVNYSEPQPKSSFAFYDYLLGWGHSVGQGQVFSDFMNDQTSIQYMNMDFQEDEIRTWMLGVRQRL